MTVEIKTATIEPRRHTFTNVAARLGADKPASRYEEATLDVQATTNFHYRPIWDAAHELFDPRRTQIVMKDWYAFRDPRHYYYGTYNLARTTMFDGAEQLLTFAEKSGLTARLSEDQRALIQDLVLPMRHYEWGANMNNLYLADYGYGTAISQAASFAAADRLGLAQWISRIGLLIDGQTGRSLTLAKESWIHAPRWQPVRHMMEDCFVVEDCFETFVAQDLAMDGVIHGLLYTNLVQLDPAFLGMLLEFPTRWLPDNSRWVDAVVKIAAAESAENRALLSGWFRQWASRAATASSMLANRAFRSGPEATHTVLEALTARATKLGLEVEHA